MDVREHDQFGKVMAMSQNVTGVVDRNAPDVIDLVSSEHGVFKLCMTLYQ